MKDFLQRHDKKMKEEKSLAPVFSAVRHGDMVALEHQLATNADVDACSPFDFRNPLMLAWASGRHDMARMLLEHGASVHAKTTQTSTGQTYTVSDFLVSYESNTQTPVINLEQTKKAVKDFEAFGGKTPEDVTLIINQSSEEHTSKNKDKYIF